MHHLDLPNLNAQEVFDACCSGIRDVTRRHRFAGVTALVRDASAKYWAAGITAELAQLSVGDFQLPGVSKDEVQWFYNTRLVRSRAGRPIYQQLVQSGRDGRCCMCGVRDASTLDHHLPKSRYAAVVVTPDNLVPACYDCNHIKGETTTPTLHAYFDDLGSEPWLRARVIEQHPCSLEFSICACPKWSAELEARAKAQFDMLNLTRLFAAQAARLLSGIRRMLEQLHCLGGEQAVRTRLSEDRDSWAASDPNCWEAATYTALADSSWYCQEGFNLGVAVPRPPHHLGQA